ncbi:Late embryogenesis abundant protein [Melia azedarach]|uniref:Late embryogenesis abundant protein n=1 Tax=Melia azedarach TaxID=155640 RepID=A0ACC1WYK4_MELAZ|nr:Late embryogenesis abundant protein [Melia azedarach]
MTEHDHEQEQQLPRVKPPRKRLCLIAVGAILLLLLVLFIIILILSLTVFKPKQPTTQLQSAKLDGIAPRVSFPAIDIQLNLTLDLQILVGNRNHASFKHGSGKSLLLYQGNQVGEADIYPGNDSSKGLNCSSLSAYPSVG